MTASMTDKAAIRPADDLDAAAAADDGDVLSTRSRMTDMSGTRRGRRDATTSL